MILTMPFHSIEIRVPQHLEEKRLRENSPRPAASASTMNLYSNNPIIEAHVDRLLPISARPATPMTRDEKIDGTFNVNSHAAKTGQACRNVHPIEIARSLNTYAVLSKMSSDKSTGAERIAYDNR